MFLAANVPSLQPGDYGDFFSFKGIEQKFINRCPNFHVFILVMDTDISVLRDY